VNRFAKIKDLKKEKKEMLIMFGDGWHESENWAGTPTRWMRDDANIIISSPEDCTVKLSFHVFSFYRNRTLEFYKGSDLVERIEVPTNFIEVSVPVRLIKVTNIIRLHVPEGCDRPCDKRELNNPDCRCLSVAVKDIAIS